MNHYAGTWRVTCDQLTLLPRSTAEPVNRQDGEYWTLVEAPGLWDGTPLTAGLREPRTSRR